MKRTPAAFLGSCHYKLPGIHEDKEVYEKIFKIVLFSCNVIKLETRKSTRPFTHKWVDAFILFTAITYQNN